MRSRSRIFDPDLSAQVAAFFASLTGPKLWLDPSDPATRFQDQAGTTLVTADGQPYGRANDKSGASNNVGQVTTTSRPLWRTDGVLSWAQADGIDDSWQSLSNFDLTATDKLTVIAGLRPSSSTGTQILIESGANYTLAAGRFEVSLNEVTAGGLTFARTASVGPLVNQFRYEGAQGVPRSVVVSVASDFAIAAASAGITMRTNGATTASTPGGTAGSAASFSADFLNFFRRNNASLPFVGNLYGLMIIGRLLTAAELTLCEQYMAQKTGVVLP